MCKMTVNFTLYYLTSIHVISLVLHALLCLFVYFFIIFVGLSTCLCMHLFLGVALAARLLSSRQVALRLSAGAARREHNTCQATVPQNPEKTRGIHGAERVARPTGTHKRQWRVLSLQVC
jgi:hypothetical protein